MEDFFVDDDYDDYEDEFDEDLFINVVGCCVRKVVVKY